MVSETIELAACNYPQNDYEFPDDLPATAVAWWPPPAQLRPAARVAARRRGRGRHRHRPRARARRDGGHLKEQYDSKDK